MRKPGFRWGPGRDGSRDGGQPGHRRSRRLPWGRGMRTPSPPGGQRARGWGVAYLVADVQGEDDREDARGRVPPVALQPAVEDVLDEGRVVDQNLRGRAGPERGGWGRGPCPYRWHALPWPRGAQRGAKLTPLHSWGLCSRGKRQRPKSQTQQVLGKDSATRERNKAEKGGGALGGEAAGGGSAACGGDREVPVAAAHAHGASCPTWYGPE